MREPDWETLNDFNFLVYSRIANSLNAALSALELSEDPDLDSETPVWWRNRAKRKIDGTISTIMAWSWLIQHKNGMPLPNQALDAFPLQDAVDWLSDTLRLDGRVVHQSSLVLFANQATFQEALLLLHSVAMSQGSSVKVAWEQKQDAVIFFVRFKRRRARKEPFKSLEALSESFTSHWRSQLTAFELRMATNLIKINGSQLKFTDSGSHGEFEFEIKGKSQQELITDDDQKANNPDVLIIQNNKPKVSHDEIVADMSPDNQTVQLADAASTKVEEGKISSSVNDSTWSDGDVINQAEEMPHVKTVTGEWNSVLDYDDVDWNTLTFLNEHAYQRLTNPLIKVMGHLDNIRHNKDNEELFSNSVEQAQGHLEWMVTAMRSWTALTGWKRKGEAVDYNRIVSTDFPEWLVTYIESQSTLDREFSSVIRANNDTFYESIILLLEIAKHIGTVQKVIIQDKKNGSGVWLRVTFLPPAERRYNSKLDVLDSFIRTNPLGDDLAVQFSIVDDLFKLNNSELSLQENQKTGEQAFAALLPVWEKKQVEKKSTILSKEQKEIILSSEKATLLDDDKSSNGSE